MFVYPTTRSLCFEEDAHGALRGCKYAKQAGNDTTAVSGQDYCQRPERLRKPERFELYGDLKDFGRLHNHGALAPVEQLRIGIGTSFRNGFAKTFDVFPRNIPPRPGCDEAPLRIDVPMDGHCIWPESSGRPLPECFPVDRVEAADLEFGHHGLALPRLKLKERGAVAHFAKTIRCLQARERTGLPGTCGDFVNGTSVNMHQEA